MEELIKHAINGDVESFTKVVKNYEKDLYRIARTRLYSDDDIADAIQNTMLIIFRNFKKLRKIEFFKTWMIKILINECNKIYRINLKNSSIKDKLYNQKAVYYQNFEKQWDEFDKLILNLSYEEQLIFTLYYKDKYSCDEISKIIKMKKSTVKSKLVRGREKLKKYIEEENIYANE